MVEWWNGAMVQWCNSVRVSLCNSGIVEWCNGVVETEKSSGRDLLEVVHDLLVGVLRPLPRLLVEAALGDGLVPQPHLRRVRGERALG